MPLYSLTYDDLAGMVETLNRRHRTSATIMNRGQLDFALKKPDLSIYGKEIYPELHQKTAVLMESVCKSHCLSDGNKRASMMAADYLVSANGATLVVPLKSVRLAVDCAMDDGDYILDELNMWFKTHIAHNPVQLSAMLEELIEERQIVAALLDQGKYGKAEDVVNTWLAFDSYPESRRVWNDLVQKWKKRNEALESESETTHSIFLPWLTLDPAPRVGEDYYPVQDLPAGRIADPLYAGHSVGDLRKVEKRIQARCRLNEPATLYRAGRILEQLHNHRDACLIYDKLLSTEGRTDEILRHLSFNLVFSGQYKKAVDMLNTLLESTRDSAYLHKLKARACKSLNDHASALKSANLALKQNPDDLPTLKVKADIVRATDPAGAQDLDEEIYCLDPDDPVSAKNMAATLSDKGKNKDAVELLDKVLQKTPCDASALYSKGVCLSRMGNEKDALHYYEKSLQIDPNFVGALVNKGRICMDAGNMGDALDCLDTALKLRPRHPVGLLNMGRLLLLQGGAQKSIGILETLLSIEPRNTYGMYLLALACAKSEKPARSLDILERIVGMDPGLQNTDKDRTRFCANAQSGSLPKPVAPGIPAAAQAYSGIPQGGRRPGGAGAGGNGLYDAWTPLGIRPRTGRWAEPTPKPA